MEVELRSNLQKVQNQLKRDPESYKNEFYLYFSQFKILLESQIFSIEKQNSQLILLTGFLSSVISRYEEKKEEFLTLLFKVLSTHGLNMESELRLQFCKTLHKFSYCKFLNQFKLFETLLSLFNSKDKYLRSFLTKMIISDFKKGKKRSQHTAKFKNEVQLLFSRKINDQQCSVHVQYACVSVILDLWRRNIWRDEKTANFIADAIFSPNLRVSFLALLSFKGNLSKLKYLDSDDENETEEAALMALNEKRSRVHISFKKENKLKRTVSKQKSHITREENKSCEFENNSDTSLIRCIYNPEKFCDKLYNLVKNRKNKFDYRLLILEVLSRVISVHSVIFPKIFEYCQKYLQPHQTGVLRILTLISDAAHNLIPPDIIKPIVETITNNFVSLQNPSEICTVGINAVRILYSKVPLSIEPVIARDLIQYSRDRQADKSVSCAAKALLNLLKVVDPLVLPKSDRMNGSGLNPLPYGSVEVHTSVPGIDLIGKNPDSTFEDEELETLNPDICTRDFLDDQEFRALRVLKKKSLICPGKVIDVSDDEDDCGNEFNTLDLNSTIPSTRSKKNNDNKDNKEFIFKKFKGWRFNSKASTTNCEKQKQKPYLMVKQKKVVKEKKSMSYSQRAAKLRKSLLKKRRH